MFSPLFSLLFLWTIASGAECGFYVCQCNSTEKIDYTMQLNVVSEKGYPTEIKKKLYKYRDEKCGDTNYVYELLTVYNVSRVSEQNGKVVYSVFPRSQQFTLFDEEMATTIDTLPPLQVRVPYNIYSSFFDMARNTSFILDLRENNYNKDMEMTFGSAMTFVDLNSGATYKCDRYADTGCASGSAGGEEEGDRTVIVQKSNWLLWVIILVLVCIIIFLIYYRRNYRYLPITERKRIDQPEDRVEEAEAEAKRKESQDVEARADSSVCWKHEIPIEALPLDAPRRRSGKCREPGSPSLSTCHHESRTLVLWGRAQCQKSPRTPPCLPCYLQEENSTE